ncbi:uncharacterized protein [Prorops nasuta]|uniref:uncharacterized protein n=1 Tax=Prorops nasuta TaxID=863751 RepID=UPI0034CED0E0
MAPLGIKRLVNQQKIRESEIKNSVASFRNKDRASLTRSIIQSRIDSLRSIWSEIRQTHTEIVGREEPEAIEYIENDVFAQLQLLFEETQDEFLILHDSIPEINTNMRNSIGMGSVADEMRGDNRVAKLPKLDLPTFAGKYEDWDNFCDLFSSLVHNRSNLPDVAKLQYLKSCLIESAADFVKGVTVTEANYSSTWRALKLRYCNPRLTVKTYLNELMQIIPLKGESPDEFRAFIDKLQRICRALIKLGLPVDQWGILIIHIASGLLDFESKKLWESELSSKDHGVVARARETELEPNIMERFPTLIEFNNFLERRALSLSMIAANTGVHLEIGTSSTGELTKNASGDPKRSNRQKRGFSSHLVQNSQANAKECPLCSGAHYLAKCHRFQKKEVRDRRSILRRYRLCFNCFRSHMYAVCDSPKRCAVCQEKHHTLLHSKGEGKTVGNTTGSTKTSKESDFKPNENTATVNTLTASIIRPCSTVLLANAQVILYGAQGRQYQARTLIDQGSEASFLTESVVQLLKLHKRGTDVPLSGLGATKTGSAKFSTSVYVGSIYNQKFEVKLQVLVLPHLTSRLPSPSIINVDQSIFDGLQIADPSFLKSATIDMILGADVLGQILLPGLHRFPNTQLIAQHTQLGWIVSGPIEYNLPRRAGIVVGDAPLNSFHCQKADELKASLEKFWVIEDFATPPYILSPEEEMCEAQFRESHRRDSNGRYEVKLPIKEPMPRLASETRSMAVSSLKSLHRRFNKDPTLANAYKEFMRVYQELGHMTRISDNDLDNPEAWYIPHHAVIQNSLEHWKLRVVFDASRCVQDQQCLNRYLCAGPVLQSDLVQILLEWRF